MDKITGSMEALSALQITSEMEGLDAECKTVLYAKEVLAVILQEVVEEYKGYSRKEIMEFIEDDSFSREKEVSTGRTNTQVRGGNAEFVQLNEKVSYFDFVFRARNPRLSDTVVTVNLHVDMEPQKTYRPGYPVEKRGIYYLARRIASQLTLATDQTDYGALEKCYSIWICRDDIPVQERYSVSFYEMVNTHNIGNCTTKRENYDLMKLVIIRLGESEYHGKEEDEGYHLLRFLNAIMYPHKKEFMDVVSDYIDFSENEELWQEVNVMSGLGQSILEEGREEGREQGREEGREQGREEGRKQGREEGREQGREQGIQALVLDHLEEKIPWEKSIAKLQKHFGLSREKAEQYYRKYAWKEC